MTTIEAMKQADYVLASVLAVSPDSITTAREALNDAIKREEAQTVAPVAWIRAENVNQAGLTSCTVKTTKPERDGYVPLFTQPALPTTGEPAKQLASGMTMGDLHDRCCDALKRSEREALISAMNMYAAAYPDSENFRNAADMLAADALEQNNDLTSIYTKGYGVGLKDGIKRAQQVAVPKGWGDAVNLANNVIIHELPTLTPKGIKALAKAIILADGAMLAAAPQPPLRKSGGAHEIWAAAQLVPGEGIEDGVARVEALLDAPRAVLAAQRGKA